MSNEAIQNACNTVHNAMQNAYKLDIDADIKIVSVLNDDTKKMIIDYANCIMLSRFKDSDTFDDYDQLNRGFHNTRSYIDHILCDESNRVNLTEDTIHKMSLAIYNVFCSLYKKCVGSNKEDDLRVLGLPCVLKSLSKYMPLDIATNDILNSDKLCIVFNQSMNSFGLNRFIYLLILAKLGIKDILCVCTDTNDMSMSTDSRKNAIIESNTKRFISGGDPFDKQDARHFKAYVKDKLVKEIRQKEKEREVNKLVRTENTVAYNAQQEFRDMLTNEGLAVGSVQPTIEKRKSVKINVTIDQVFDLWEIENQYRESFSVDNGKIQIPNIFVKISGVLDNEEEFWKKISKMHYSEHCNYIIQESAKYNPGNFYFPDNTEFTQFNIYCKDHKFFSRDKNRKITLNREAFSACEYYRYAIYSEKCQSIIFDAVDILCNLYDNIFTNNFKKLVERHGDPNIMILYTATRLLNDRDLNLLHQYNLFKVAPKLIVYAIRDYKLNIGQIFYIILLHFMFYDVVLLAPNGYMYMNDYLTVDIMQTIDTGNYNYNVNESNLGQYIHEPRKKKRGFIDWLIGE